MEGDRLPGEVEGRRLIRERLDVSGRGVGVGVVAISPAIFFIQLVKYILVEGLKIQLIKKQG